MAKATDAGVKDAALLDVKNNVERLVVCSAQPANFAGVAAVTLGDVAFAAGDVTGPGDNGSAREQTYGAKSGINVDTSGNANHVALVDDTGTRLLLVTTISNAQEVTSGNTMSTAAFAHSIAEAT
jgi:hypothetical protein